MKGMSNTFLKNNTIVHPPQVACEAFGQGMRATTCLPTLAA